MERQESFFEDEYAVIGSPINRGGAAILYFLFLFFFSDDLYDAFGRSIRVALPILAVLECLGLWGSIVALRHDRTKFPAQIAIILFVGGLLSIAVPVAGFYYQLYR